MDIYSYHEGENSLYKRGKASLHFLRILTPSRRRNEEIEVLPLLDSLTRLKYLLQRGGRDFREGLRPLSYLHSPLPLIREGGQGDRLPIIINLQLQ